jgi:ribosomal subunit interface protein
MDVRITARHVNLGDSFSEYAHDRVGKLTKFEPRLLSVDLIFDNEHGEFSTEARAEVPGIPTLVAKAENESKRKSLDDALDKLGRQLKKERSKRVDHQAPPAGSIVEE